MSAISSALKNGLRTLKSQQGGLSFVFKGQTIPCVIGTLQDGVDVELGGSEQTYTLTLNVLVEDFPTSITVDLDTITVDSSLVSSDDATARPRFHSILQASGVELRVVNIRKPADGSFWSIDLAAEQ
tara:strand:+ start:2393 stop:2773 length:381 start_codon:yes stop_codon:yes gene_type:complete